VAKKVGGQAVFRGVMLRDDARWAVAVRTPDGRIAVRRDELPTWGRRWMQVPVLRGIVGVAVALPVGLRAMRWSRQQGLGERSSVWRTTMQLAIAAGALLVVPDYLAMPLLIAFLAVTGQLQMLFQYHGAEHKVVAAHEAGVAEMTPEVIAPYSTRHVRCGTSLLLVLGIVAAVLSLLELPAIVSYPLVLGVAVELQTRAAKNVHLPWVRTLLWPGLALQRLTTREPSAAQLEVAIAACQALMTSDAQPSSVDAIAVPA
jgi:uncharacterized protein YqhQ